MKNKIIKIVKIINLSIPYLAQWKGIDDKGHQIYIYGRWMCLEIFRSPHPSTDLNDILGNRIFELKFCPMKRNKEGMLLSYDGLKDITKEIIEFPEKEEKHKEYEKHFGHRRADEIVEE